MTTGVKALLEIADKKNIVVVHSIHHSSDCLTFYVSEFGCSSILIP